MRIVAGEFRSRVIDAVEGSQTRPTGDKVKEAVFSRIGPYFDQGIMLDAYAGSGNISFEALSRGMQESYMCDVNMDEDEYMRLISDQHYQCPYYRNGDDYRIVRHQM